jgi:hypothetical protein
LVIPFGLVVLDVLRDGAPEMPLPDRNQPVEAFFFDRPHEALCMSVRIRRTRRGQDHPNASITESTPPVSRSQIKRYGGGIAPLWAIVSVRTACCMNNASGCGVDPRIGTRREAKSMTNTV